MAVRDRAVPAAQLAAVVVLSAAAVVAQSLVESFDSTGATSGAASWPGDGFLRATFPIELTGTGAEGAFNPPAGMTTLMHTDGLVGGQPREGIWNFTDVDIPATATVRFVGPYQAHVRCTGSLTLEGTINASAATGSASAPTNAQSASR